MFESGKKKEPKLVFVHKSSPPTVAVTRTTEPQPLIPRFSVVANGQVKQSRTDDAIVVKPQQTVASNSAELSYQKPQLNVVINSSGISNQKTEQTVANNGTGQANQKSQQTVINIGNGFANQKPQQNVVVSSSALGYQKPQQIFQQIQQPKVEEQSLQKQAANQPSQKQLQTKEQQSQKAQLQKEQPPQGLHVSKEQLSRSGQFPSGQQPLLTHLQTEQQPTGALPPKEQQVQHKERNETRPSENPNNGISKVFLVSHDREMQQATITFTEEKNVDSNKIATLTEKSNGYSNVYPPQLFRKDSDASKILPQSTQDQKTKAANQITEQFEGFSIYRGRQEMPNSKPPITKEKTETVTSTPSAIQSSSESVTNPAKSVSASIVVTSNSASVQNNDDDSVTLRHPQNFGTVSSAQKQQAPFQKQHQQYQRTHQLLQAQQQAVIIDPYRQGEYRYQTMPHMRLYSYSQAVRQPSAKAIRLVGPYIQEPGYQQPTMRHAPSLKNRSLSASSAAPVRYPGGTAHWQASPTQGYYVYTEEANTIPRVSTVPTDTSYTPDAATFKQAQHPNGQRPKSILKSPSLPEAPEWHNNARPIKLPRPQSMLNPSTTNRDFDFSTILTANSDKVSYSKHPHHLGRGQAQTPVTPNRPLSAGSNQPGSELTTEGTPGTPQRKSVTFNSQVRLHTEDRVSTVTSLVVDS